MNTPTKNTLDKKRAGITAIGGSLPEKKITNVDLEKMVDTSDAWIKNQTGIRERRKIADSDNCSDIGARACRQAIERAKIDPEEIDLLITTSLSPDKLCPSTASVIQGKLGIKNAAAFDLAAACAGFPFAVTTAASFIEAGYYKNVLVVGTEAISRLINWQDRNTCILFGDGAGAALLQPVEAPYGILGSYLATDGTKADLIEIPAGSSSLPASETTIKENQHFLQMKGHDVFKFAVRVIPNVIESVLAKANIGLDQVDLIIPHQANMRIIEAAAKKVGLSMDKFYTNLEYLGNTSTASVPLALNQAVSEGKLTKGSLVVILGFGAGLSWGANVIRWGY